MKKLFRVPLLGGALTLFILASGVSVAHATHAWGTYHWGHTTTDTEWFTLPIGDNTTGAWRDILVAAINDWAAQEGNDVSITGTAVASPWTEKEVMPARIAGTAGSQCKAVQGTTQVCNKKYGYNGWLGLAQIWVSGSHITQGTAKVNDSYFSLTKYNTVNEKRHVMCQEVAHTFGLGHQSENGSSLHTCMDYFSNTEANEEKTQSTVPNYHDYEQLSLIYNAHTDSSSTVATIANALATQADANPSDDDNQRLWGRLLSQSENGRSSVYEQTVEHGIKIIRHVRWTEETAAKCPVCDHRFHDKD